MASNRISLAIFLATSYLSLAFNSPAVQRFTEQSVTSTLHASARLEEPPVKDVVARDDLPPVLQQIVDERREYELNLGKAMDTLKKDYPVIIKNKPDFSIYHEDLNVVDPSGVQIRGLKSYKQSFAFFQSLVRIFYSVDRSKVQFRMMYDFARSTIRISWNVMLVPKIVGNRHNALYIDGISAYKMDSNGKIIEHRVEQMLINSRPIVPPYGVLSALRQELMNPQRVPVGVGAAI